MLLALDLIHFVSFGGERIARSERRKKKRVSMMAFRCHLTAKMSNFTD